MKRKAAITLQQEDILAPPNYCDCARSRRSRSRLPGPSSPWKRRPRPLPPRRFGRSSSTAAASGLSAAAPSVLNLGENMETPGAALSGFSGEESREADGSGRASDAARSVVPLAGATAACAEKAGPVDVKGVIASGGEANIAPTELPAVLAKGSVVWVSSGTATDGGDWLVAVVAVVADGVAGVSPTGVSPLDAFRYPRASPLDAFRPFLPPRRPFRPPRPACPSSAAGSSTPPMITGGGGATVGDGGGGDVASGGG